MSLYVPLECIVDAFIKALHVGIVQERETQMLKELLLDREGILKSTQEANDKRLQVMMMLSD